jgi:hypothetical protein
MKKCGELCFNLCNNYSCFGSKYVIKLPLVAESAGIYSIELDYMDAIIVENETFAIDDDIIFELYLNENQEYLIRVTDPEGDVIVYTDTDDVDYSCFIMQTKQKVKVCN